MQRTLFTQIIAVISLLLAGCAAETPTQAPDNSDAAVAAMVAVAAGHQSNGFSAVIEDVVIATGGESRAHMRMPVMEQGGVMQTNPQQLETPFVRRVERDNVFSEWRIIYRLSSQNGDASDGAVETQSEGVFRSATMTMEGGGNRILHHRKARRTFDACRCSRSVYL